MWLSRYDLYSSFMYILDQLHPVNRSQFDIIFAVEAAKTADEMKYADDIDAVFGGAKPAFDVDRHVAIAVKAAHGSAEINKQV